MSLCLALLVWTMTYYSRCLPHRYCRRPTPSRIPLIVFFGALGAGTATYLFLPDSSRAAPTLDHVFLSYQHFTPTRVVSSEESGPHTKLLKIALAPALLPPRDLFDPIWSVYIKDDDIQVERPYTPLLGVDENGHMLFWIKKYPKGEVGRWLHSKTAGSEIELRGPIKTWKWERDSWDEVVMVCTFTFFSLVYNLKVFEISGGTGITPFVQLFHTVISKPTKSPNTRFTLIHSSRAPGELPPPAVLEPLTAFSAENPEKFKIHIFVDTQDGSNSPVPILHINTGRVTDFALERCLRSEQVPGWWGKLFCKNVSEDKKPRRTLFLVCGPEP